MATTTLIRRIISFYHFNYYALFLFLLIPNKVISQENPLFTIDEILNYNAKIRYDILDTLSIERYAPSDIKKIKLNILNNKNAYLKTKQDSLFLAKIYRNLNERNNSILILDKLINSKTNNKNLYCKILKSRAEFFYYESEINLTRYFEIVEIIYDYCGSKEYTFFNLYNRLGLQKIARKSYLEYRKGLDTLTYLRARTAGNISEFFLDEKNYDSAYFYAKKGLKTLDSIDSNNNDNKRGKKIWRGLLHSKIGLVALHKENYKKAITHFTIFDSIFRKLDQKWAIETKHTVFAKSFINLGNLKLASLYIDSLKLNNKLNNIDELYANYYHKKNIPDSAIKYYEKVLKNLQLKNEKQIAEYSNTYSDYITFQNNYKLSIDKKNELKRKEIELKQQFKISTLLFIILLILGIGLIFSRRMYKKLNNQKKLIKNNLDKNIILLKEVDHRVKNNLQFISSMLNIQKKNAGSDELNTVLQTTQNRILILARIHENLIHFNKKSHNLKQYIHFITISLAYLNNDSLKVENILIIDESIDPSIDIDIKMTLGLILNELITNSYKYAFTKKSSNNNIKIEIKVENNRLFFKYKDSGNGFESKILNNNSQKNLGLYLIKKLTMQLQSKPHFNTEGTMECWFTCPLKIESDTFTRYVIDYKSPIMEG